MVIRVKIEIDDPCGGERFFSRIQKGGRVTIPKLTAELLNLKAWQIVKVTLWLPDDELDRNNVYTARSVMNTWWPQLRSPFKENLKTPTLFRETMFQGSPLE